jgi:hypothetical protein
MYVCACVCMSGGHFDFLLHQDVHELLPDLCTVCVCVCVLLYTCVCAHVHTLVCMHTSVYASTNLTNASMKS